MTRLDNYSEFRQVETDNDTIRFYEHKKKKRPRFIAGYRRGRNILDVVATTDSSRHDLGILVDENTLRRMGGYFHLTSHGFDPSKPVSTHRGYKIGVYLMRAEKVDVSYIRDKQLRTWIEKSKSKNLPVFGSIVRDGTVSVEVGGFTVQEVKDAIDQVLD